MHRHQKKTLKNTDLQHEADRESGKIKKVQYARNHFLKCRQLQQRESPLKGTVKVTVLKVRVFMMRKSTYNEAAPGGSIISD